VVIDTVEWVLNPLVFRGRELEFGHKRRQAMNLAFVLFVGAALGRS
jgi:hypothetical protein